MVNRKTTRIFLVSRWASTYPHGNYPSSVNLRTVEKLQTFINTQKLTILELTLS